MSGTIGTFRNYAPMIAMFSSYHISNIQHPASGNTPALTIPGVPEHPEAGSEAREMGCLRLRSKRRMGPSDLDFVMPKVKEAVSAGFSGEHGRTMTWGTGRMGIWVGNCSNQQEFPELKNEHVIYNCTTVKENGKWDRMESHLKTLLTQWLRLTATTMLDLLIHTTTMHESLPRTLSPGAPTPKTTRAAPGWHRCTVQTFSFEGAEVCWSWAGLLTPLYNL